MSASSDFAKPASKESITKAITALKEHGFMVSHVADLKDAAEAVYEQIPKGAEVFTATSITLDKAGITAQLNSDQYHSIRDEFSQYYGQEDKKVMMRRIGSAMDYAVGSVHAITEDGQVIIASATGSQLPAYVYGANHVIWVVGAQKIVPDLMTGIKRIEDYVLPLEDVRAMEAYGVSSSINKLVIYRKEGAQRVSIIIVDEVAGF